MPRHSCCEVRVMQLYDILLLRTSAILPEAISSVGLAPTTFILVAKVTYLCFSLFHVSRETFLYISSDYDI